MRVRSFRSGASLRRAFSSTPWYESSQIQLPGQPLEDDEPKRPFRHWYPIPKKLEEVVKLPFLSREDPTTIRSLWLERFGSSPKIVVGVMAREEYDSWETNARACPMFICPVPRPGGGYINLVTQYNGQQVLCSFLEQYRQNPEQAPIMLTVALYDDLKTTKGIVLLRADLTIHPPDGELTKNDAKYVVKFLRQFYTDLERFRYVETFNLRSQEFDFMEMLETHREWFQP